jgi:hypothetical protein
VILANFNICHVLKDFTASHRDWGSMVLVTIIITPDEIKIFQDWLAEGPDTPRLNEFL